MRRTIPLQTRVGRASLYVLRAANPLAADRLAEGWPPAAGRIIMTPYRPPDYYPSSVCLIMEFTSILLFFCRRISAAGNKKNGST
jgi:hypothetical protein